MRFFPEIKAVEVGDTLTVETGPALFDHLPFIATLVLVVPVWVGSVWGALVGWTFPDGPLVPLLGYTFFGAFAIYALLITPIRLSAVFRRSPERVEITTTTRLGAKTQTISPQPGQSGFVVDRLKMRLAVLGPGRWNRMVFLSGPFWRSEDLAKIQSKVTDWLAQARRQA